MGDITSKVDICNLALGHLGITDTIANIDTPTNSKERTFALWYDVVRKTLLKNVVPNFALARDTVAQIPGTPTFGYAFKYAYPSNAVKLLGVGNIEDKLEERIAVEGGIIYTDEDSSTGLNVRFIKNVTDVTAMSPEFQLLLSLYLAEKVCLAITQSTTKQAAITKKLPREMSSVSGLNAQENPPVRRSNSRFRQARYSDQSHNTGKK